MPFSLFLALKYLRPKRSLTSVITCVSVLGVVLGVASIIIIRAVMTGFGDLWQEKILDFKPHISVVAGNGVVVRGEKALAGKLAKISGVTAVSPEIDTRVLLEHAGRVSAPILLGVEADRVRQAFHVGEPYSGRYDLDGDSIVLGVDLASSLGVGV